MDYQIVMRLNIQKFFQLLLLAAIGAGCICAQPDFTGTGTGIRPDTETAFFQQGVRYTIDARLIPDTKSIQGSLKLSYTNHSPDTLKEVYFLLPPNAFLPGSSADQLYQSRGEYLIADSDSSSWGWMRIDAVRNAAQECLAKSINGSEMKVEPSAPILPGMQCEFIIDFVSRFNTLDVGMHTAGSTFLAVQWYPSIAVYDSGNGWHRDLCCTVRCFADFGRFKWSLVFPDDYYVAGTGRSVRSTKSTEPGYRKMEFDAEMVQGVSFVALKSPVISEVSLNGVQCISVTADRKVKAASNAAELAVRLLDDYSRRYGDYPYQKLIILDSKMTAAFPMMLVLPFGDRQFKNQLSILLAESWTGILTGVPASDKEFLNTGIAEYIAAVTVDSIWGTGSATNWENWYARQFYPKATQWYTHSELPYLSYSRSGFYDMAPVRSVSRIQGNYSPSPTAAKSAVLLSELKYVLGADRFDGFMKQYFRQSRYRHFTKERFTRLAEDFSGRQLDWFFDSWSGSDPVLDYGVRNMESHKSEDGYTLEATLVRFQQRSMPLDIKIRMAGSRELNVHIPNCYDHVRSFPDSWIIAEPWQGQDDINREYHLELSTEFPVEELIIDPERKLADINRLNNQAGSHLPFKVRFDNMDVYFPSPDKYDLYLRPSFRLNDIDGAKIGVHWQSGYLVTGSVRQWATRGGLRYGMKSKQAGYQFFGETSLIPISPLSHVFTGIEDSDGRFIFELGYTGEFRKKPLLPPYHALKLIVQLSKVTDQDYISSRQFWDNGEIRSATISHTYHQKNGRRDTEYSFLIESSLYRSDFDYSRQFFTLQNWYSKKLPLYARLFIGNQSGDLPGQMAFRLTGASYFGQFRSNWLFRSDNYLADNYLNFDHVQVNGGANLLSYRESEKKLDWVAGINLKLDVSTRVRNAPASESFRPVIPMDTFIFGTLAFYKLESNHSETFKSAEVGLGCRIQLPFIPRAIGQYQCHLQYVWPLSGERMTNQWVYSIHKSNVRADRN